MASTDGIVMIAPESPGSLTCRSLGSLGGFLNRDWREADFRAGRRDARDAIRSSLSEWVDYEPDDDVAYRADAPAAALGPAAEARLRRLVEAEVDRELSDIRVGGLAGLFGGWKSALKKHAADRVLSDLRDEIS